MSNIEPTPPITESATAITSSYEQDQKTQAQIEAIENEIKSQQKLTSDRQPLSNLVDIYKKGNTSSSSSSSSRRRRRRSSSSSSSSSSRE